MLPNNVLFFTVGDSEVIHRQANFAVLSVLAHTVPEDRVTLTVVTDKPEWYRWLDGWVEVLPTSLDTFAEWRGIHDHFFRIKIKAMQQLAASRPGNLIYLDSDVVCTGGLEDFFTQLDRGQCFMDELDHVVSRKGGSARKLWIKSRGKTYGKFKVDETSAMWCAGVVALPANVRAEYIEDALDCMDKMCEAGLFKPHLEQFALSLSLSRNGELKPTTAWFTHYWGNKGPWNALIAMFLATVGIRGLSVEQACAAMRDLPLDIPKRICRTRLEKAANSVMKRIVSRDRSIETAIGDLLTR